MRPTTSIRWFRSARCLGAALALASCLGDPVGPSSLRIVTVLNAPDTLWVGAPGEPLAHPVLVRVTDVQGRAIAGASLNWRVQGRGAVVVGGSTTTDVDGQASAQWVLGTNADEPQILRLAAMTPSSRAQLALQARAIPHIASRIFIPIDSSTELRLGDTLAVQVNAVDPYGNVFPAPEAVVAVGDTMIASVSESRLVGGPRRGRTIVRATSRGLGDSGVVHVTQYISAIIPDADTVRVGSIGVSLAVSYAVRDDRERPVHDTAVTLTVDDAGIVQPTELVSSLSGPSGTVSLVAISNGATQVTLSVSGVSASVQVVVAQVPATVTATLDYPNPIVTLPIGAVLPLSCSVIDSSGHGIPDQSVLVNPSRGTVIGQSCGGLVVARSGYDTLVLVAGSVRFTYPLIVAVTPVPSSRLGEQISVDTLPGVASGPWAPSARLNSQGEFEVYYTAYSDTPDSSGYTRGDLQRLKWVGGSRFIYDGVAVRHDDDICSPQGQGIENISIAPRSDGPGWRMLYAAGSNECYGWQVFSAVSSDERNWVKEVGVRLSNGGTAVRGQPPWPVGEGIVMDQLSTGEWRVSAGTFEHIDPPENRWQITEWRSTDQVNWQYVGSVVTSRDMPQGWQGSVYSPTIREFVPGMWRMIFTARGDLDRSALWTAVSTDREHWQVEGELLGDPSSDLYYAALADDHLVFIRQDKGGPLGLSLATVQMP